MSAERIIDLYDTHALAWDRQRSRDLIEHAWLDRFCEAISANGRILDIGCGMAEPIAAHLIGRGFELTGVDASPSLIALCRERFPHQRWIVADMRELDLGERFDGLLAWHSFFHLSPPDQRPMFARFARHAAPGAALMFTSGQQEGEAIGEWQGEPLYHGSLDTTEYARLLASNGFCVEQHRASDPDCGFATIWLARSKG
jgi:SAM-dependent methyltransferase